MPVRWSCSSLVIEKVSEFREWPIAKLEMATVVLDPGRETIPNPETQNSEPKAQSQILVEFALRTLRNPLRTLR
jgi:hypothetical protein